MINTLCKLRIEENFLNFMWTWTGIINIFVKGKDVSSQHIHVNFPSQCSER